MNPTVLQETATACLRATLSVWRQASTNGEPLEVAFARLFGRPMGTPMLTVAVPFAGRLVTVHLHAGGIAAVYDQASNGWELRKLPLERAADELSTLAKSSVYRSPVAPLVIVKGEHIGTFRSDGKDFLHR